MKDKVLAELVAAAEGGDGVALTMLADRIADADPEDRIECLKAWCGDWPRPVPNFSSQTFSLDGLDAMSGLLWRQAKQRQD